jgi:hypothetical protein
MLIGPKKPRRGRSALRAVVRDAREAYRRHGGAMPAAQPRKTPAHGVEPRHPSLSARAHRAASRLSERPSRPAARRDDPDVVLDVPRLHVDEIDLKLDELKARVALEAHVLDLLRLDVGADAELRGVKLQIKGVDAQALLKVRLENLTVILDRVMSTVDRNPQILERLTDRLGSALDEVGSGAARAVGELGEGAGSAVRDIGGGAGSAVDEVGGIARALAPDAKPARRSVVK